MSFKTTLVLLVLLVLVGAYLLVTRDQQGTTPKPDGGTVVTDTQRKLIQVDPASITKLVIEPMDGKRIALEREGGNWRLAEPVKAPADRFVVEELARALSDLRSRGQVDASAVSPPAYYVYLTTTDGRTIRLTVGHKSAIGDSMLVVVDGGKQADSVNAELMEKLERPAKAYRQARLIETPSTEIRQVAIASAEGNRLVLGKDGDGWQVIEPQKMPAEQSEVTDILVAISGLRAEEFTGEDVAAKAGAYQLADPKLSIWYSTEAPTTQPTASQPAGTTIRLGRYDSILKKNVFAAVDGSSEVVKVSANLLNTFDKKPLDLRDRKVLDIDPEHVASIAIGTDIAATTQPTSRPAVKKQIVIERRKETPATSQPATQAVAQASTEPATQAATTQPATQGAAASQPASKWVLGGDASGDASDSEVASLLAAVRPLRVEKYLEAAPTTQPARAYTLTITTDGQGGTPVQTYEVRLTDPGDDQRLIGTLAGLAFELDRYLLTRLGADFGAKAAKPEVPEIAIPDME